MEEEKELVGVGTSSRDFQRSGGFHQEHLYNEPRRNKALGTGVAEVKL